MHAALPAFSRYRLGIMSTDQQSGQARENRLTPSDEFKATHPGHVVVGDQEVHRHRFQDPHRLDPIRGRVHPATRPFQNIAER